MIPTIIYEDEHILAVDKPSGLVVHAGVGSADTLSDWVLSHYPELSEVGEPFVTPDGAVIPRPGMVHRLDKETSGVMVLAKHQDAFHALKEHFRKRKVVKEYHAFVYGQTRRLRGSVSTQMGRSRTDFRKRSIHDIQGVARDALTEYVVSALCDAQTSFVRCYPKTGRTHQIRVHLRSLHLPIICDTLYAPTRPPLLGFSRMALHAYRLTLTPHWSEKPITLVAEYPDDFTSAMKHCQSL